MVKLPSAKVYSLSVSVSYLGQSPKCVKVTTLGPRTLCRRLEPTISTLTAIRSIQMAKRDSDGYRIRKYFTLKSILFIMFANLKLVLRSYTSLYGIFMSASLTCISIMS